MPPLLLFLNTPWDSYSTTSMDSLFWCTSTLLKEKCFLISNFFTSSFLWTQPGSCKRAGEEQKIYSLHPSRLEGNIHPALSLLPCIRVVLLRWSLIITTAEGDHNVHSRQTYCLGSCLSLLQSLKCWKLVAQQSGGASSTLEKAHSFQLSKWCQKFEEKIGGQKW